MNVNNVGIADCYAFHKTDEALLVEIEGEEIWVPLSLISEDSEVQEVGDEGELIIPEWFAKQKGLLD